MTKVKVVGLRPSLTLLLTIAETLQPVTGCHKISAGLAGDLGADPLGFKIQTCLKILQATEAEESVWSSCVACTPDVVQTARLEPTSPLSFSL